MKLKPVAFVVNEIKETSRCDWHRVKSKLVFKEEYVDGLHRIKDCRRIWVLFGFHRCRKTKLRVRPRKAKDDSLVGIFASRGIQRPNRIGLTLVRLIKAEGGTLVVAGLDAFDGSPVYDIKPHDPDYDQ